MQFPSSRLALAVLVLPVLGLAVNHAQAQFSAGPPPELKRLTFMVGKAAGKGTMTLPTGEKAQWTGNDEARWVKNGFFLQADGTVNYGPVKEEATQYFAYDEKNKLYRFWRFSNSNGLPSEASGKFEGAKLVMTSRNEADGSEFRLTWEPKAANQYSFLLESRAEGKYTPMLEGTYAVSKP